MSLSLDQSTIEELKLVKSFLDILKDPDKIAKLVEEASKVLADQKAVVEAYTTVEKANDYLAKILRNEEASKTKLEAYEKEMNTKLDAKIDDLAKQGAHINSLEDDVNKRRSVLELQEKAVETRTANLSAWETKLLERSSNLDNKEKALASLEKDLQEKTQKLQSILG